MYEIRTKKVRIKYPIKLGYSDKSGQDNWTITDANDNTVVWGTSYNDPATGTANKGVALAIIKSLNETKPIVYVKQYATVVV